MNNQLKPCPFCKNDFELDVDVYSEDGDYAAHCPACTTTGPFIDPINFLDLDDEAAEAQAKAHAADAWNTRPIEAALSAWADTARTVMQDTAALLVTVGEHEQAARLLTCINACPAHPDTGAVQLIP